MKKAAPPRTAEDRRSRDTARDVVRTLRKAGFQAFWAGGCVRDMLLERVPLDYDVATSARPEEVEGCFRKTLPLGRQFGVVVVLLHGHQIQVSTFRAEAGYSDGRRPDGVRFTDAREDALRRDFTINGLFYDPLNEELHDWVGGQSDLSARRIQAIGEPSDRFAEDHLRLLRAVRFAVQLGFRIAPATMRAIQAQAASISRISAERIRDELMKVFHPAHAAAGLDRLRESGLLPHVLPEVEALAGCEQSPEFHPEGDVFEHVRLMLSKPSPTADRLLPWAVLLHDIAKPSTQSWDAALGRWRFLGHETVGAEMTEEILRRLRFPNRDIETIKMAVRYHMQFKDAPQMRRATLNRMLLRPTFPFELELHRLDCLGSHGRLDTYEFLVGESKSLAERPPIRPPLLQGRDLLALGMRPGRELGRVLGKARELQLGEEITTHKEAVAWAKAHLSSGDSMEGNENEVGGG